MNILRKRFDRFTLIGRFLCVYTYTILKQGLQGLFNYTPVHWYNRAKQNITYKCVKYLKYHSCTYVEIIFDITWQNNDYSNTP